MFVGGLGKLNDYFNKVCFTSPPVIGIPTPTLPPQRSAQLAELL